MFYLGSLWHGGGANQTAAPRLGVILEYAAGWLRPQENHCLAVPREIVRALPERLQELLGYDIYPPFVGYVDGRHPRKVLVCGFLTRDVDPGGACSCNGRQAGHIGRARCDTEVHPMKQYLLSVYQPAETTPPPEVLGPIMDKVGKWRDELKAAGAWVFTGALAPAAQPRCCASTAARWS